MNPDIAEATIKSKISVTRQQIIVAKSICFDATTRPINCESLLLKVYSAHEIIIPRPIVLHRSMNMEKAFADVAASISWRLATVEALWSLVHSGMLVAGGDVRYLQGIVEYTTALPGGGGESGRWTFDDYTLAVPDTLRRTPSMGSAPNQFLSEPDLYLHNFSVSAMHTDISDALSEAVKCFRAELFTASLAMLGKASEGAWLELGASLIAMIPKDQEARYAKQIGILDDTRTGPNGKVEAVITIFDHQEIFSALSKAAGVAPRNLREVSLWSDIVRDSRNTVHFRASPVTPNTYEKIATLLLGAVPNIKLLYRLKNCADTLSASAN